MLTRLGSLMIVAVLCGIIWRVEIEMRWGWPGLAWISGFHCAALFIGALFATWLYFVAPCTPLRRKLIRSIFAMAGTLLCYFIYDASFTIMYARFLGLLGLSLAVPFFILTVIPLSVCAFAKFFSPSFPKYHWILTPILFMLSFPLAMFLLSVTGHRGGAGVINTIKSGYIFLGLVLAAGFPFIAVKETEQVD